MSSLSTTTSIIQSAVAISFILSVKLPVVIFFKTSFVYNGEGFDFTAAASASFTILFLSTRCVGSPPPEGLGEAMSSNNTGNPIPAK